MPPLRLEEVAHATNNAGLIAVLAIATLEVAGPRRVEGKDQDTMFGRMFPELPAYNAPDDAALATLTAGAGPPPGPLFDTNLTADDNPDFVPSFFTYFGQFVDHDLTLDLLPLPSTFVDPTTIENHRNLLLDLDSLYGDGPKGSPELYESDKRHMKVNGRDLPTRADGSAIVSEGRNDENQVIAQIHVAFLRAHNALVDSGLNFDKASEQLQYEYQWILVHEFLPSVVDPGIYADVFRPDGSIQTRYYDPKHSDRAFMPVEFSVAAYRFGHSIVRRAYILTQADSSAVGQVKTQVFNGTDNDLHGGRQILANHTIFWPNFLNVDGVSPTGRDPNNPTQSIPQPANFSRKIDTLLSSGLFTLPIPGAEASGPSILALRNLQRARAYGLPSGQAVAARLGLPLLSNAIIASDIPRLAVLNNSAYLGETPLWLYILAESQIFNNGRKLGQVGSRIVCEVIGGLLDGDNKSYYRKHWTPPGGDFRAQDLLRQAGVI